MGINAHSTSEAGEGTAAVEPTRRIEEARWPAAGRPVPLTVPDLGTLQAPLGGSACPDA